MSLSSTLMRWRIVKRAANTMTVLHMLSAKRNCAGKNNSTLEVSARASETNENENENENKNLE